MAVTASDTDRRTQWACLALLLTMVMAAIFLNSFHQHDLQPVGCDPFGYARQARLFREHGLKGFDTAIHTEQAEALVSVAKRKLAGSETWYEPTAPHCHHYVPSSGKVILQYPPGTGAILALFPEQFALPYLLIWGGVFAACCIMWLAARLRNNATSVTMLGVATAILWSVLASDNTISSVSVAVTLLALPLVACLARQQ